MHAWEWEGVQPDIQTIGKGLNGGYQALSAVLMNDRIVTGLKAGSGAFANGMWVLNLTPLDSSNLLADSHRPDVPSTSGRCRRRPRNSTDL